MTEVSRYHPLIVALHWVLAFFIIAALTLGALVMAKTPNSDPMKIEALRAHMSGGAAILILMLIRLLVRSSTRRPPDATTRNALLDRVAWWSHRLLYVAVIGMALSGLVMALQTRLPWIVFGHEGHLPPTFWAYPIRWVHYGFSRLLIALIALHIAGALYHTLILRDHLLRRMWFGRRTPVPPGSAAGPETRASPVQG
ncbi:MAG TPA: cytochrome b/b6 domain-containing protein [Sphingomicrobium sp.]|nr:cytochrome b/b6 domain-containing protein [Sphingomicrobium sp.]